MIEQWIKSDEGNAEFLESCGVILGPRVGGYWENCSILVEAESDLMEHWGMGDGDSIMFGPYEKKRDLSKVIVNIRERILCSECNSTICADGTCSYPLCPSWVNEIEIEIEETLEDGAGLELAEVKPRAAKLRP